MPASEVSPEFRVVLKDVTTHSLVAAPLPYYYALELAFFLARFMAALLWSAQASSEPHTRLSLIKHVPGKFGAEPARSSSCSSTSEGWEKISQGERFLRTPG